MRSSGLTTFVFLALAVTASPTPIDPNSVQARDAWTPAARRDVFLKRAPAPEPAPEPEPEPEIEDLDKRSPFTFSLPKRLPFSGTFGGITINPADNGLGTTAVFADKPSSEGLNARFPFFFKRAGKLEARDIEALEKRKAEMERREAEIAAREAELAAREAEELVRREAEELAKREAEELARREAEELAAREAEELARREAEERAAQEAMMMKKREVLEDIEARQAELEAAKREYDELFAREYEREFQKRDFIESRDLEAREPLSFTVTLNARDFGVDEDLAYLAKRDPQFNLNSFLQQLRGNTTAGGTAAGGGGTNAATNAISRLQNLFGGNTAASTALTNAQNRINSALSRFGFNFRRDELEQLAARAPTPFSFKEDTVSKREPFDFDAFVKAKRSDISL